MSNRTLRLSWRAIIASLLLSFLPPLTSPAEAFDQGSVSPRPTSFSMLAAFEFTTVFNSRTSPVRTTGNNTVFSNGTYWYWRDKLSFGFSPDSTVNIDDTRRYDICASTYDVNCSPGSSTSRMSWRIDASNIMAGGRAGATIDITSGNASMYCFYSNATTKPTYFPSGIQRNVLYSTITSGGWSLAGEKYYRAIHVWKGAIWRAVRKVRALCCCRPESKQCCLLHADGSHNRIEDTYL